MTIIDPAHEDKDGDNATPDVVKHLRACSGGEYWPAGTTLETITYVRSQLMQNAADEIVAKDAEIARLTAELARANERNRRWVSAGIGALAKIGVPTPVDAMTDFTPDVLASEIHRLGYKLAETNTTLQPGAQPRETLTAGQLRWLAGEINASWRVISTTEDLVEVLNYIARRMEGEQ